MKWYYIGSTNDLKRRVAEHNTGKVLSTKFHVPLALVYSKGFDSESAARAYERMLKDKRLEKEKLIRHLENDCGIV